jgi:lipopolysaccharide export system permease protein
MHLIHRYLLRQFLSAYLGCFLSLFVIYLVLDVFTKMDEFAIDPHRRHSQAAQTTAPNGDPLAVETKSERAAVRADLPTFFRNMLNYYAYRAPVFFDRMNAFIVLLAATFSLGWFERQNEITPLLAAGVPLRRLLTPLWGIVALILALGVLNREWLIPRCAPFLLREAEDPLGRRPLLVQGCYDEHDIHIEGRVAYPERKMIQHARLILPATAQSDLTVIQCKEMFYRPANERDPSGWWLMACTPDRLDKPHPALHALETGNFFLRTNLSYDRLTRRPNWHAYQSTARLTEILEAEERCPRRGDMIALVHRRFTTPLLEMLLTLLCVPLILGHPGRPLIFKVGGVMMLFGGVLVVDLLCGSLARAEYLDPVLASWLPLLLLGPFAVVRSDALPT